MSRSSRRRFRRAGEAYYPSSDSSLPRAHEGVRRFNLTGDALRLQRPSDPYRARRPRLTVNPILAKQALQLDRRRALDALKLLQIRAPVKVRFCVQRKQRREVLFARNVAGRGGGRHGRYRRTATSAYSC